MATVIMNSGLSLNVTETVAAIKAAAPDTDGLITVTSADDALTIEIIKGDITALQ